MNVRVPILFPSLKSSTEPLDTRVSHLSTSGLAFVEQKGQKMLCFTSKKRRNRPLQDAPAFQLSQG